MVGPLLRYTHTHPPYFPTISLPELVSDVRLWSSRLMVLADLNMRAKATQDKASSGLHESHDSHGTFLVDYWPHISGWAYFGLVFCSDQDVDGLKVEASNFLVMDSSLSNGFLNN